MSPQTLRAIMALAGSEIRLLWRNRLVASTAVLLPLAMGAGLAATGQQIGDGWGGTAGLQLLTMLLLTVYISATTAVAARRSGLVLKRLRSGETPEWAILVGMLLPTVGLALVQSLLLCGMLVAFGASLPDQPLLLLVAMVGGAVLCAALALATTRITTTAEMAQVTTTPYFFAALAGALWVLSKPVDDVTQLMLIAPGGAIVQLVRGGWDGGGEPLLAIVALVAWIVVAADVAKRTFRWEPRT